MESEEGLDWKQQAESFKTKGNEYFKNKDYANAIIFYTKAIELDPEEKAYYSNRSAAYLLKGDSKSKSLKDAEKCVSLDSGWEKGYFRLGAAQHALGRFEVAISTYSRVLDINPSQEKKVDDLTSSVRESQVKRRREREEEEKRKQEMKDRQEKFKEEGIHRIQKEKEEEGDLMELFQDAGVERNEEDGEGEEDEGLTSFLEDIGQMEGVEEEDFSELEEAMNQTKRSVEQEKYSSQDLGNAHGQVGFILQFNHKWKNLNPYHVLQLDTDATEEDIRHRYRKLSALIHPDKCRELDDARDAFEEVKSAYQHLMDEEKRRIVIQNIKEVQKDVRRERKRLLAKRGVGEESLVDQKEAMETALFKHFAEIEMRRVKTEKNQRSLDKVMKEGDESQAEIVNMQRKFNKNWARKERREKRVNNWRDFQGGDDMDRDVKKQRKEVSRESNEEEESKFGKVDLNAWRKQWR